MKLKREFMISQQLSGRIWDAAGPFDTFEAASQYLAGRASGEYFVAESFVSPARRLWLMPTAPVTREDAVGARKKPRASLARF